MTYIPSLGGRLKLGAGWCNAPSPVLRGAGNESLYGRDIVAPPGNQAATENTNVCLTSDENPAYSPAQLMRQQGECSRPQKRAFNSQFDSSFSASALLLRLILNVIPVGTALGLIAVSPGSGVTVRSGSKAGEKRRASFSLPTTPKLFERAGADASFRSSIEIDQRRGKGGAVLKVQREATRGKKCIAGRPEPSVVRSETVVLML